jgi:large subunit ribosomal protein L25
VSDYRLSAEPRTEFGKGGARRTRRDGKIPAVLYGHGLDPQHVSLPAQEFTLAVKRGGANVLLTLDIAGTEALAVPKSIQRHAIKGTFDHVDLLAVRRGEKIAVDIALVFEGEVARDGVLQTELTSLAVEAEATHIPTELTVDVEGLAVGTQITAGEITLPAGTTLTGDPEQLVLVVSAAPTAEQLDAEVEQSEAELGIVEDKPDADVAADETASAAAGGAAGE